MKFLKSVGHEMKLTSWPSIAQTKKDSATVIFTSLFFAVFIGAVDLGIRSLIKLWL